MNKTYVVLEGRQRGIFTDWETCKIQVDEFKGQQYKSYELYEEAENAYKQYLSNQTEKTNYQESIVCNVDYNNVTKKMKYSITDKKTNRILYKSPNFNNATQHIGGFLAIVEALKIAKENKDNRTIYSSNLVAIRWVENMKVNTKIRKNANNRKLFKIVTGYTDWLEYNNYSNIIMEK